MALSVGSEQNFESVAATGRLILQVLAGSTTAKAA